MDLFHATNQSSHFVSVLTWRVDRMSSFQEGLMSRRIRFWLGVIVTGSSYLQAGGKLRKYRVR